MENPEETKTEVEAEPEKPTLVARLKGMRWTFKVKTNLTQYVTVEPLICFYMFQIFVVSLIEPYHFHKACLSLDENAFYCDVITINKNEFDKPCANFSSTDVYCKGFSNGSAKISCEDIISTYDNDQTKAFVKPEDYSFCKVILSTIDKAHTPPGSMVGIAAIIITFLVIMVVSIWSDKYSKRKICLIVPILGQLIISILNLHGALSPFLSFEFINTATTFIESISGGMSLFLFGCFSYMNDDTIRHTLLFRFGMISLVMTVYRFIPVLYDTVYQHYHDDDSYISLISLNLVFNIVCLFYVKVILNESKAKGINAVDNYGAGSASMKSDTRSVSNGKRSVARNTKRKQLAKAFSLDVIWDYILIVFKKRIQTGRLIIILFLAIVLVGKMGLYGDRFTLSTDYFSIDIIDIDGAIFVIISVMMLLFKISHVAIAILVMGIPTAARLLTVILVQFFELLEVEVTSSATDFYTPFKRIASCSLLLAYVDKNETRIFLIVQAVEYLPKVLFQLLSSKLDAGIWDVIALFPVKTWKILVPVAIFGLPVLPFIGLGVLYKIGKNYENFKTKQIKPNIGVEDLNKNPWTFIEPVNFEIKKEIDNDQQSPASFKENEYSTDL